MAWDRERYRREVLEPARQSGNVPPRDLYVRYGVRGGRSDPGALAQQVDEAVAYWRELDHSGRYQRLARVLLTAHAELERGGPLTPEKFSAEQEKNRQEQAQRLTRMAEAEARSATHAGPDTVTRLHKALAVAEAEVAAALSEAGVRVVAAFPALPAGPHPKQAALAQNVQQLGRRLSAEVVFPDAVRVSFRILDGFRLADGRRVDEEALRAARDRTAALPYTSPATAPTGSVLAILGAAARHPGELDELLLSEVVETLRPLAGQGFPQLAIAREAIDLGLDEDEAGLLAGALLVREAPGRQEASHRQATEALDAGRLRTAQRLAREMPATDPLTERIAAQDARVAALTEEADKALTRGRRDLAAARLADAFELASDDPSLTGRLLALPPLPPRNAIATPNEQNVVVTWESSPVLAGRLRFLVRRGLGSGPDSPVAGTLVSAPSAQNRVIDEDAPSGTDLCYSVFACYGVLADRMAEACSPPAVTKPVMLLTEVTQVQIREEATSVTVAWQPPHPAQAIIVRRGVGVPPQGADDGNLVGASLTGFTDTGLRTGMEYVYRIMAVYRASDGQRRCSPGVVLPARPAPDPEPVTDLTVTVNGSSSVVANWTRPRHGEVRLVAGDAPPQWQPGHRVTERNTPGLRELHGVPRSRADGRDRVELSLRPGRHYLVPLTAVGNRVVAGNVVMAELVEQFQGLVADRMHDSVRLAWAWPCGATDAMIRWAGGEHRCSKRAYFDEGPVTLTVGPAETLIEVHALYPRSDGPVTAPPATVLVPARDIEVRYHVHRGGMFRRQRRVVEFLPEKEVHMPAVLVVQSTGQQRPDDAAEGETLLRIEPQAITPERRVRVAVDVRDGPGWLACFLEPAKAGVLLFHPLDEEMRLP